MRLVRPRVLVHRGVVQAAGFLVEVELLGLPAARRRILSNWRPGTVVERIGPWLLLLPPAPVRIDVQRAWGAPLVKQGEALLAAPLAADELDVLEPGRDSVVTVRGGMARVHPPSERVREDPAGWFEVGAFEVAPVESLGARPLPPTVVEAPPANVLRQRLSGVIPPSPSELEKVLAALEEAQGASGRGAQRRPGLWGRFLAWLAGERGRPAGSTQAEALAPLQPRGRSFLDRLRDRVQRFAARLLNLTRLARLIGRAQAEYLNRMMDMFDRGDLQEALRHALPLNSGGAAPLPVRPALGVPSPRKDLSISPRHDGTPSALGVTEGLMEELRRRYRKAFERLKREGRIDEAAFVLAELLQANEEAVSFLEEHGRLELAAEVAEARGLAAAQVVRLWFLAGNVVRAVWTARRTGAFADAVARLERSDLPKARALRVIWAQSLAEAGNFAAAVEVIWPLKEGERLALAWLDRAIELGGAAGVQALVRKLVLSPTSFPEVRERAVALLEDDSLERARERRAFAEALMRQAGSGASPELRTLARPTVRALVRDRVLVGPELPSPELQKLASFSMDGALQTDLPPLPPMPRVWRGGEGTVWELSIGAQDAGALRLFDAAPLPSGRTLVALGELGARLLTRDGRTVHHFDVPAHRLVVSDHGDRAIALTPRGEARELWRLDLLQRRASRWCTARVDAYAPDFDGSLWFVSVEEEVFALDALAADFKALWRVNQIGGPVVAIAREASQCHFVVDGRPPERWSLELPGLVLRRRSPLGVLNLDPESCDWRIGQSPEGDTGLLQSVGPSGAMLQVVVHQGTEVRQDLMLAGVGSAGAPVVSGERLAAPLRTPRGMVVLVLDTGAGSTVARFHLEGALRATLRLRWPLLTVIDDRGRLLVFDVEQMGLLRDLRL